MANKMFYEVILSFKGEVVYKDTIRAKSPRTAAANVLVNRMDDEFDIDKIEVHKRVMTELKKEIKVHKRETN